MSEKNPDNFSAPPPPYPGPSEAYPPASSGSQYSAPVSSASAPGYPVQAAAPAVAGPGYPPQQGGGYPPQQQQQQQYGGGYPQQQQQAGYPQQRPGGYGGPSQPGVGYPMQGGPVPTGPKVGYPAGPAVVTAQPTVATTTVITTSGPQGRIMFSTRPYTGPCPKCAAVITSRTVYHSGLFTFLACGAIFLFSAIIPCAFLVCWVPFCMDSTRDCSHYCPNCNELLGTKKQM